MNVNIGILDKEKLRTWLVLLRQTDIFKKSVDAKLKEQYGVSISRFDVLSALDRAGQDGLKAGDLTKKLVASDGNTTQVTTKLVRDGLIERRTSAQDRRCVIYALTQKGALLFQEMAVCNAEQVASIFVNFTAEDLSTFKTLLGKLNLNDEDKLQEKIG
ncbi:MAG: hypothetical protein COA43_14965 [Robiginitomaculum sp.]|nr:MAG: hypothetical protein COA43_14965 [Robiginitomaculum sp.]